MKKRTEKTHPADRVENNTREKIKLDKFKCTIKIHNLGQRGTRCARISQQTNKLQKCWAAVELLRVARGEFELSSRGCLTTDKSH